MDPSPAAGRLYKSRRARPCDSCRKKKTACDMPDGPPCRLCLRRCQSCTFDQGPGSRKRRAASKDASPRQWIGDPADGFFFDDPFSLMLQSPSAAAENQFGAVNEANGDQAQNLLLPGTNDFSPQESIERAESMMEADNSSAALSQSEGRSDFYPLYESSLDDVPGAFSFYIGPTGAADVHLLRREPYDMHQITRPRLSGLKYRMLDAGPSDGSFYGHPTLFGITDQKLLSKAEPRADSATLEAAWAEMWAIIDLETAWHLVQLYRRFVDPYFPILASHQIPRTADRLSNMPLCLLTAICATALPFVVHDESLYALLMNPPSSQELYKLCWLDISQQFHAPSLATVQACLLFLQRLPTNAYLSDTAFSWTLMSGAIAAAQTIGLHRDPSGWDTVPIQERRLRKRLWWSLWTMERWMSLIRGMPSHLIEDDFDVSDLEPADISHTLSTSANTSQHLDCLVRLTRIMARIQSTYYTVRAIASTSSNLSLSLDQARALRGELKVWRETLPSSIQYLSRRSQAGTYATENHSANDLDEKDLDGNGSIYLSYIVTHMTLFRALLRPLERWHEVASVAPEQTETLYEGAKAVIRGSLLCVKEFVEFVEAMTGLQWNAFWHSWSRANFAIAGSFMVHLLHIVSPSLHHQAALAFEEDYGELRVWIERWRRASRVSAGGAAGAKGLANLGLLRVETMLTKLLAKESA